MKKILNVIVGCEYSGIVRDAFIRLGHNAVSCDLLDTEQPGPHYKGDILDIINDGWDIFIAHPPCTYVAGSGERWFKDQPPRKSGALVGEERRRAREQAIEFFMKLMNANIPQIALENPIGIMSTVFRKPDQIIQPWMFGHGETKATCLWLKNLPLLVPTNIVEGREQRIWKMSPGEDRWKERSRTFQGIAEAMATQWSDYCLS